MNKKEDNKLYGVQCLYVFTPPDPYVKNSHAIIIRPYRILIEGEFAQQLEFKPMHEVLLESYLYEEANSVITTELGDAIGKVIGFRPMTKKQYDACTGNWEPGNPENIYFVGNCPGKPVEQVEFGCRRGLCYPESISPIFTNPNLQAFHLGNLGIIIDELLEKSQNDNDYGSYQNFMETSEKISFPLFPGETAMDINNPRSVTIIGKRKQYYETDGGSGLIHSAQISQQRFVM